MEFLRTPDECFQDLPGFSGLRIAYIDARPLFKRNAIITACKAFFKAVHSLGIKSFVTTVREKQT